MSRPRSLDEIEAGGLRHSCLTNSAVTVRFLSEIRVREFKKEIISSVCVIKSPRVGQPAYGQ